MLDARKLLDSLVAGSARKASDDRSSAAGDGGLIGDLLGRLQKGAERAGLEGSAVDMARQVGSRATEGVRNAAGKVDEATGAGKAIEDIVRQVSGGKSSGELIAQAKDLIARNPAAAGALAGVLGGLLLGTRSGRGLTVGAAKLGGLVLIGGLAYKAWQNYQAGKPPLSGDLAAAPEGSGYEAGAQSDEAARLYIRAMIAAASADGTVDEEERARVLGGLEQAGLAGDAARFLAAELARPASIGELAAGARTPEMRAQTYAAARLSIDPDTAAEQSWLAELARRLSLDPRLVAHLDEAAGAARA
jgi:uncharacterized membrane protein YebE (DUF533 family)